MNSNDESLLQDLFDEDDVFIMNEVFIREMKECLEEESIKNLLVDGQLELEQEPVVIYKKNKKKK